VLVVMQQKDHGDPDPMETTPMRVIIDIEVIKSDILGRNSSLIICMAC
jgi:hypothetical protein